MIDCDFCHGKPLFETCFFCDAKLESEIQQALPTINTMQRPRHEFGKVARHKMLIHARLCMTVHFRDKGKL